jgi:hypothetical protein
MRNILAALAIALGILTLPTVFPAEAAAACNSADCVPNVARNVIEGAPCEPGPSFVFGLDSDRQTLICNAAGMWARVGPLVGEREVALPCDRSGDTAQEPLAGNDLQPRTLGVPLKCAPINGALKWVHF